VRNGILAAAFLVIVAPAAAESAPSQVTKPSANLAPTTPCLFDLERGEVPNCIRENPSGEPFIAPQLVKELPFDSHGLAAVSSPEYGWMYVDRRGFVIVMGVAAMDNGADSFHDGLVRVVRNGNYGFANRRGHLVVPPIYDGAMNFERGRAIVCKGCQNKCAGPECEHHSFVGGEWFQIDVKGTVVARIHPVH